MYCVQTIKTEKGDVIFGFVGYNEAIHVKLIAAHLHEAPERFRDIRDIPLKRVGDREYVVPVIDHKYYDDFAILVYGASKRIDWAGVERELYAVNMQQLDVELSKEIEVRDRAQDRITRLQNSKDVARDKAENGKLQQALSYIQSVIFRLL